MTITSVPQMFILKPIYRQTEPLADHTSEIHSSKIDSAHQHQQLSDKYSDCEFENGASRADQARLDAMISLRNGL
jgi:hypothetical protein